MILEIRKADLVFRERYHAFLTEHPGARFYRAETPEGAEIVYCPDSGKGVWFLPNSGMGIIQPKGLQLLAQIVQSL